MNWKLTFTLEILPYLNTQFFDELHLENPMVEIYDKKHKIWHVIQA